MSRLIDADRLKEVLEKNFGHTGGASVLAQLIDAQPTAEPKRGKWIHVSEEMWKCDQCGEISCCSPKYCPDCGSRNEVSE